MYKYYDIQGPYLSQDYTKRYKLPEGYRLLGPDEKLEEGDYYLDNDGSIWPLGSCKGRTPRIRGSFEPKVRKL